MTPRLALAGALLAAGSLAETEPAAVTVEAVAFTAGPYGEAWTLTIPASGEEAFLEIGYMLSPVGDMKGSFLLDPGKVAELRRTIEAVRFTELPERIEPDSALLHQPTAILDVRSGDQAHRVFLYDPDQFEGDPDAQRFFAVWDAAFALVPLRPSW